METTQTSSKSISDAVQSSSNVRVDVGQSRWSSLLVVVRQETASTSARPSKERIARPQTMLESVELLLHAAQLREEREKATPCAPLLQSAEGATGVPTEEELSSTSGKKKRVIIPLRRSLRQNKLSEPNLPSGTREKNLSSNFMISTAIEEVEEQVPVGPTLDKPQSSDSRTKVPVDTPALEEPDENREEEAQERIIATSLKLVIPLYKSRPRTTRKGGATRVASRKSSSAKSRKKINTPASDRPKWKCGICSRECYNRSHDISRHMQVHADPQLRPYQCDHPNCGFTSIQKSNYETHLHIHNGAKFTCGAPMDDGDTCQFRCRNKSHMDRHRKDKHGVVQTKSKKRRASTTTEGAFKRHSAARGTSSTEGSDIDDDDVSVQA